MSTASEAEKIANVQALRFKTRVSVERLISRNNGIFGGEVGHDEKDFFVAGTITLHPLLLALPTQAEVDAHKAANPVVEEKVERKAPARKSEGGACDLIRSWTRANPDATKEDALAQFPDLNPATVKIQFRKVRLGEV